MKSGTLFWLTLSLTVGIVNVPNVVSGQTYRQYDRRDDTNDNHWDQRRYTRDDGRNLQGTWYWPAIGICVPRLLHPVEGWKRPTSAAI